MESVPGEVTQLLKAMHAGDTAAADHLLPLVNSELHRLAQAYMRRERPDHTLQATSLINEAYMRPFQRIACGRYSGRLQRSVDASSPERVSRSLESWNHDSA